MSKKPGSSNKKQTISQETRQKQELKTMKKMDVTHLKQDIHSLRDQLQHLVAQKIKVQKQMQTKTQQYMNQSYELQKIAKKQQQELIDLQNKLKILKNTFSEAQNKKKTQHSDQIQLLANRRQNQRDELKKVQDALAKKVQHLKKYTQREVQYQQKISELQARKVSLKQSHTKDIQKIKHSHQVKRTEIKQITNKQIQTIQSTEVGKLRQKLSKQQQIIKENQIMQDQIKLCLEQKVILQNQCKLLGDEMKNNGGDDSRMLLGSQATETYERSLRVIKLEGKINKLKQFMNEEISRLQQQQKNIDKTYDENQKLANTKLQKLKNTINLKQRDYKKVKACSQMVLNQRSSLESYLLEVFYENPSLNYKQSGNVNQILRKFFVKINSKKTPVSYKNYMNFDMQKSRTSELSESQEKSNA